MLNKQSRTAESGWFSSFGGPSKGLQITYGRKVVTYDLSKRKCFWKHNDKVLGSILSGSFL